VVAAVPVAAIRPVLTAAASHLNPHTPLLLAATYDRVRVARMLVARGADRLAAPARTRPGRRGGAPGIRK